LTSDVLHSLRVFNIGYIDYISLYSLTCGAVSYDFKRVHSLL